MHQISIIIPCYNHGQYLLDAIKSVDSLKQEGVAEVIIINDGSTDIHTIGVFKKLERDSWKIINQERAGLAEARNNGIKSSASPYILPLDCDNIIIPSFVHESIKILNSNPSIDIVYSDCRHFGDTNFYKNVGEFDPCRLINDNYVDTCAVYRRGIWSELNGYDKDLPHMGHEDWDFWIGALMKNKKFHYLPVEGFKYRVRADSMLNKLTDEKGEENRKYIYSKYNFQLLNSIRMNYVGDAEKFKLKYFRQIESLNNKRLKNMIKLLIGKKFE
jgi:glycosyltransferase involved in cell wall biosynthesis